MSAPVVALLLAGGVGSRFSAMRPKQYIEVEGRAILELTMLAFERHPWVTDIYVVCAPEWADHVALLARRSHITRLRGCLPSGATSFESLRHGVEGLLAAGLPKEAIVMVHDGVRPLVSADTISDNISTCRAHGNAITVVYSNEAYMHVSGRNVGDGYAARDEYMRAQTPHTFPLGRLAELLREADERGLAPSQSLFTLANELGHADLHIAEGDLLNFKVTKPSDMRLLRALLCADGEK